LILLLIFFSQCEYSYGGKAAFAIYLGAGLVGNLTLVNAVSISSCVNNNDVFTGCYYSTAGAVGGVVGNKI